MVEVVKQPEVAKEVRQPMVAATTTMVTESATQEVAAKAAEVTEVVKLVVAEVPTEVAMVPVANRELTVLLLGPRMAS